MWDFMRHLRGGKRADEIEASDSRPHGTDPILNRYFALLTTITNAKADHDYPAAIHAARETFPLLADVVRAMRRGDGSEFVIGSIPAIDTAGPMMAVGGDHSAINEMRSAVTNVRALADWIEVVQEVEHDADLVDLIVAAVAACPGLQQHKLKVASRGPDGRRLSTLTRWLEDAGRIKRARIGSSTYEP